MRWASGSIVAAAGTGLCLVVGGGAFLFINMVGDPGWHYAAVGGKERWEEGLRYELPDQHGAGLVIHASVFSIGLHTELDLTNRTGAPLSVDARTFRLTDANGSELRMDKAYVPRCEGKRAKLAVTVPPGQSCRFSHAFSVQPLERRLPSMKRNPDLRKIALEMSAAPRKGRSITVRIPLNWEE